MPAVHQTKHLEAEAAEWVDPDEQTNEITAHKTSIHDSCELRHKQNAAATSTHATTKITQT